MVSSSVIRNIAVIVAGIDEEYQNNVINGINDAARKNNMNVAYFAAFGGVLANSRYDIGEYNIYNLINFKKFDGAILLTNTISAEEVKKKVIKRVEDSGIPAVVLDCGEYPEFYDVKIDNSYAMREMVRHVICEHKAKVINFISGPLSNPEALDRYNAFLEVMGENGLQVDMKRIYFGEFRGIDGKRAAKSFINSELEFPEAIICANDAMALSAVNELEKHGYRIPEDVIVTGFDNTYNARHYSPALTSVDRPLYDAGFRSCEVIINVLDGKKTEKTISLKASPVFSESCGCKHDSAEDIIRYKKSTYKIIDECRCGISLLNRMTTNLAEADTPEENFKAIERFLGEIECEKCSLCLCSEWMGGMQNTIPGHNDLDGASEGYTLTMSAPIIWTPDKITSIDAFASEDMYPEPLEDGGNISYFLPLHFREICLGYYVITNGDFPIRSMLCHSLIMNIGNSIENIRKLMHLNNAINELDKLYVIDPLTGIYNRNGFIRIADMLFRKCSSEHKKVLISFIDMDGLKIINDNYGHHEGDFALQRLAEVLQACCINENFICTRFGGDEFIIFGANVIDAQAELLERRFLNKLAEINRIICKPYKLSGSIGTCVTEVDENSKLFSIITTADEKMYEQKKRKKTSRYLRRE